MSISYAKHVIGPPEYDAVLELMQNGWLARGPVLDQFEEKFKQYVGSKSAISCANGSAALEIVLRALDIGPGDEVIVPNVTWVSTASAASLVGATPVFCDIEEKFPNICVKSVEDSISPRTKAVIAVHFAGVAVDMEALAEICHRRQISLIEDAAHAIGGSYSDGAKIGSSSHSAAACFSFHPAKNMTTGEGGMITTQNVELGERMALIRSNGVHRRATEGIEKAKYDCLEIASNYHLNGIAAAIGICQLDRLDSFVSKRAELWSLYAERLENIQGLTLLRHPKTSGYNLCLAKIESRRDEALLLLSASNIDAYYHYPLLSELSIYKDQFQSQGRSSLTRSKDYRDTAITLPLHPSLEESDVNTIADALISFLS